MNITGVSYSNQAAAASATASAEPKDTSKVQFLTLLASQLQYQDPLNPMENTEFLGQMAQFSNLEQLMEIRATLGRIEAAGQVEQDGSTAGTTSP